MQEARFPHPGGPGHERRLSERLLHAREPALLERDELRVAPDALCRLPEERPPRPCAFARAAQREAAVIHGHLEARVEQPGRDLVDHDGLLRRRAWLLSAGQHPRGSIDRVADGQPARHLAPSDREGDRQIRQCRPQGERGARGAGRQVRRGGGAGEHDHPRAVEQVLDLSPYVRTSARISPSETSGATASGAAAMVSASRETSTSSRQAPTSKSAVTRCSLAVSLGERWLEGARAALLARARQA